MQDRYVADVGDFGKYGLLRCLTGLTCGLSEPDLNLGIIWYLTPSCLGNANDGRHLNYLDQPTKFEVCDKPLFCELVNLRDEITNLQNGVRTRNEEYMRFEETIFSQDERFALKRVQQSQFLKTTLYYDKPLHADNRSCWWKGEHEWQMNGDLNLIFMDPDNGLRMRYEDNNVRFVKVDKDDDKEDPGPSPKHVYIEEIKGVIDDKSTSLVFYHHLGRHGGKHDQQINKITNRLKAEFSDGVSIFCVRYRRGSGRAFFILVQGKHKDILKRRIIQFSDRDSPWVKHKHLELAYPK